MAKISEAVPGAKFGRWTVTSVDLAATGEHRQVMCRCDCGEQRTIRICSLGTSSKGCGCLRRRHGHRSNNTHSKTLRTWNAMLRRCLDVKDRSYPRYGGRGIKVCDRWRESFTAFLADMGERPAGKTLDRKDSKGNYEPGNCRWATLLEQQRNRGNVKLSADIVRDIVVGRLRDSSSAEIGKEIGVSANYVDTIRRGEVWTDVVTACRASGADPATRGPL